MLTDPAGFSQTDGNDLFRRVLAHYDVPAYVRRARGVQDAWEHLLAHCRRQRDSWLLLPRIRLGMLKGLAGDFRGLTPWLTDDSQIRVLEQLVADLKPRLRVRVSPTSSSQTLRRGLGTLIDSIARFDRRWQEYIPGVELTQVNRVREDYNRYFLLEKECAVRSARVARLGFSRLEPLGAADLLRELPLLPVPQLRNGSLSSN